MRLFKVWPVVLVAALFGEKSMLSRIVYVLVGLSALYQLIPLFRGDENTRVRSANA